MMTALCYSCQNQISSHFHTVTKLHTFFPFNKVAYNKNVSFPLLTHLLLLLLVQKCKKQQNPFYFVTNIMASSKEQQPSEKLKSNIYSQDAN